MKKILILLLIISFSSCKSSKRTKSKKTTTTKIVTKKSKKENNTTYKKPTRTTSTSRNTSKADYIVDHAKQFEGVRYKWGGTTKSGMDCSGLVYESFSAYNVTLPRISRDMAKKGHKVDLKKVTKGDLLFFKTGNRRNSINHVGIIVEIKDNDIKFIHASTSKGVIISGLNETYWLKAFQEARRVL